MQELGVTLERRKLPWRIISGFRNDVKTDKMLAFLRLKRKTK